MKTIYVVTGSCGEYSDHNEWTVCGYEDEEKAKRHVVLASEYAKVCVQEYEAAMQAWRDARPLTLPYPEYRNPYDPYFHNDYTGTFYNVDPVEIRDDLPEVVTH